MQSYGVILAGGRSSRMGEDKAGLQLGGSSLLQRCRELFLAAGVTQVLISGRPALEGGFADVHPDCGPPGAVLSVLAWLQARQQLDGSLLLFLPVDMPLLQLPTLQQLMGAGRAASACHFEGEVFPCSMLATPELYAWLQDAFSQGQEPGGRRSMKAILRWLQAQALPVAPGMEQQFLNANTPADWERVQQLWQQQFPSY
jgi:molybdopterin-guanine dinucleotide biosynthesis protein A